MTVLTDLCGMYFKNSMRQNPATGKLCGYYRLVESYRNMDDRVCHRTLLHIGFTELTADQMVQIQKALNDRAEGRANLFASEDPVVKENIEKLWNELISKKKVDLPEEARKKRMSYIESETMQHREVRELGSEWLCYQAIKELGIAQFLKSLNWDEEHIQLAVTQLVSRAAFPHSELRTSRWIRDNSAVCEVTGYPIEKINKDRLYQSALKLYSISEPLEEYLSVKTNELFDITDKIILYDLTNTYFEGRKENSKLAKFGKSKEKRTDAKLVVLALVTNMYGFVKTSKIFEGNMSDSKTLKQIISQLRAQTSEAAKSSTVVIDAGIATQDNLKMLEAKGYKYVCVSRTKIKDIKADTSTEAVHIITKTEQKLTLERVQLKTHTDYILKVNSPGKKLKEQSMRTQFEQRLEERLELLKARLTKKYSVKKTDKINQAIGRLMEKYPSVSKYYDIEVKSNQIGLVTAITYEKKAHLSTQAQSNEGVYFLRTNMEVENEVMVWNIYNTIREIESTFRCLKTDLELRPIYHKNDASTMAHLHLGILAYTVVNTIRQRLKPKGITHSWTEIKRIAHTQKLVTTRGQNMIDEIIEIKKSSVPTQSLKQILDALGYKKYPFVKKSVVHKIELLEPAKLTGSHFSSG